MGIKQLNKIIKKYAPRAIREINIQDLRYKKIGIDSSILMYKYRYASQESRDSHIHGFIQRVCFYLKHGILPVFVFDGIPPQAKRETLDRRINQKIKIENKIKTLMQIRELNTISTDLVQVDTVDTVDLEQADTTDSEEEGKVNLEQVDLEEEIYKLSKQITYVTREHRKECKYILRLLGIPIVEANGEAENTCASMQKLGITDYTFTEDTDALTFGSGLMLKSAKKLEKVVEINLSVILEDLHFTMDEFIDFCILCGCDYCPTIPRIGPITAMSLIKEYSNIETILENLDDKYDVPKNFNYVTARELFNYNPLVGQSYNFNIQDIQLDKLKEFITVEKDLSFDVYENIVKQYTRSLGDYTKHADKNKLSTPVKPKSNILNYFSRKEIINIL